MICTALMAVMVMVVMSGCAATGTSTGHTPTLGSVVTNAGIGAVGGALVGYILTGNSDGAKMGAAAGAVIAGGADAAGYPIVGSSSGYGGGVINPGYSVGGSPYRIQVVNNTSGRAAIIAPTELPGAFGPGGSAYLDFRQSSKSTTVQIAANVFDKSGNLMGVAYKKMRIPSYQRQRGGNDLWVILPKDVKSAS